MKKVAFTTLGCKANQYDTECMIDACRRAGHAVVAFREHADVYVVNTCTVTALADAQGRNLLRRARRRTPGALIVVAGCSAQNDAETYRAMPEVDHVLGVRCADALIQLIEQRILAEQSAQSADIPPLLRDGRNIRGAALLEHNTLREHNAPLEQSRARALLKIQDGCDKRCTYCAVWRARGKPWSVPADEAVAAYRGLSSYPEVMLTGIHIGQYGRDFVQQTSLWDLLDDLVALDGGPRIRLSSLDPDEHDRRLIDLMRHPRVCRHVHLSVQSGSARVLASMGRSYTPDHVRRAVESLAKNVTGIGIGMDLIAGFPGETDDDHARTRALVEEVPLSFLHVFPFSARTGTAAATMDAQVPVALRKERARELIEVGRLKKRQFLADQVGACVEGVVVSRRPDERGLIKAVADNYMTIYLPGDAQDYASLVSATITDIVDEEAHAR